MRYCRFCGCKQREEKKDQTLIYVDDVKDSRFSLSPFLRETRKTVPMKFSTGGRKDSYSLDRRRYVIGSLSLPPANRFRLFRGIIVAAVVFYSLSCAVINIVFDFPRR